MRYVDTNVLLACLTPESGSAVAEEFMLSEGEPLAIGSCAEHRRAVLLLEGWHTTLRAGDGLHLAIASANGATVYTLDRGMAEAGFALGVSVKLLG